MILIDIVQLFVLFFYALDILISLFAFKKKYFKGQGTFEMLIVTLCLAGTIIETKQTFDKVEKPLRHQEFFYRLLKFVLFTKIMTKTKTKIELFNLAKAYKVEVT